MGQAVLDLPDPLEEPPAAGAASADDLLAQLAGDEIDRLLGEAEAENGPLDESLPNESATAPAALPATDVSARSAIETPTMEPAATSVASGPVAGAAVEDVAAVDTAAMRVAQDTLADDAADATETPATDLDQTIAAEAAAIFADPSPDSDSPTVATAAQAADERAGLLTAVAAEADDEIDTSPLPIFLRPLEWLNAPLAALPETTREFLGKAAIVTLINSAAIIAYVVYLKK